MRDIHGFFVGDEDFDGGFGSVLEDVVADDRAGNGVGEMAAEGSFVAVDASLHVLERACEFACFKGVVDYLGLAFVECQAEDETIGADVHLLTCRVLEWVIDV